MMGQNMPTQIGWFNLKEDIEVQDCGYECAAWYRNIAIKAGRYPVIVYDLWEIKTDNGIKIDGHVSSVRVLFEGTIITDNFGSYFCGIPISDYDEKQHAGEATSYSEQWYLFSVAEAVLHHEDTRFELFPEYEAKEYTFIGSDGIQYIGHGIYKKEVQS